MRFHSAFLNISRANFPSKSALFHRQSSLSYSDFIRPIPARSQFSRLNDIYPRQSSNTDNQYDVTNPGRRHRSLDPSCCPSQSAKYNSTILISQCAFVGFETVGLLALGNYKNCTSRKYFNHQLRICDIRTTDWISTNFLAYFRLGTSHFVRK